MEAAHASTGLSGSFRGGYALQNVNHIAHLSGALIGVLLVWLVSRLTYQPSDEEMPSRRKKTRWTKHHHCWFEFPQGTNCMVMSSFILVCAKISFFQSREGTPKAVLYFQEALSLECSIGCRAKNPQKQNIFTTMTLFNGYKFANVWLFIESPLLAFSRSTCILNILINSNWFQELF